MTTNGTGHRKPPFVAAFFLRRPPVDYYGGMEKPTTRPILVGFLYLVVGLVAAVGMMIAAASLPRRQRAG